MENIKIVAIVRSKSILGNYHYDYVFNRPLKKLYTKIDKETIIGHDEGALSFYRYEEPSDCWKAFGGSDFDLHLTDGTTEHCYGQWWDGMSESAKVLYNQKDIVYIGQNTVEALAHCYVFVGSYCEKKWLDRLASEYDGKVYDYWEFKEMINEQK